MLKWSEPVVIDGVETTASDWLREHYHEYTAQDAAELLSGLGIGSIGRDAVRWHLRKHGLRIGRGVRPRPRNPHAATGAPTEADAVIKFLRKRGPCTLRELSEHLDRAEVTVAGIIERMRTAGYGIEQDERRVTVPQTPRSALETQPLFRGGREVNISFGIVSDTHAGSKYEQPTALHDIVNVMHEEYGIQHILHAGDAFAGMGIYRGQQNEVYAITAEEQAEAAAGNLPRIPGVTYYMLGGNHDYSFYRASGFDCRVMLAQLGRDDIVLLGYDVDDVPLLPSIDARLWHPSGGAAYALSYRGQKYAAQMAFDELMDVVIGDKPTPTVRVVVIGHFHTTYMFDQGPMVVLGAGCFEGQNGYLKTKGLVPQIGGWVVHCRFVDGMLHRITPERIRYREIEDDWRPWYTRRRAVNREITVMEPIFKIQESS